MNAMLTAYNQEQYDTLRDIRSRHPRLDPPADSDLKTQFDAYLAYRERLETFLAKHFSRACTPKCYTSGVSACCSREGIITFFADMVVNVLVSGEEETDRLQQVLLNCGGGRKCVYLGERGCLWRIKPIVCELFLCDAAHAEVLGPNPDLAAEWGRLKAASRRFTWPDRPVLFDLLEKVFMDAGMDSSLMFLHKGPGLLRVKRTAGLI